MSIQNEPEKYTKKELHEIIDEITARITHLEEDFNQPGSFSYMLSAWAPIVIALAGIILALVGSESSDAKRTSGDLIIVSLVGVLMYKIDRMFEYFRCRFDLYDTLFTLEESIENEQSTEN